jgi:hypothetical protein
MKKFNKNDLKNALIGLGVVAIYIIGSLFQTIPLQLAGVDYTKLSLTIKVIYSLVFELFLIAIICAIYRHDLIKDWKDIKTNHKKYFNEYFKYWIIEKFLKKRGGHLMGLYPIKYKDGKYNWKKY